MIGGRPRGRLWLHVGTHKTGTTSVQHALRERSDTLRARGIAVYPEPNAWRLANAFIRPEIETTPRAGKMCERPDLAAIEAVRGIVAQARGHSRDMVISSEEFCLLRTPLEAHALLTVLAADFARVIPILVLRNEEDWRASREDQLRKTGFWDYQISLRDDHSTNGTWYYDRDAIRAFWSGIGAARIIDYDRACRRDGDILPAFAAAMGMADLFKGLALRMNVRSVVQ